MNLAYLTREFPFEHLGEAFLTSEVQVLAELCDRVHVIPVRPKARRALFGDLGTTDVFMPLASVRVAWGALSGALAYPRRAAGAFAGILAARCSLSTKLKNLSVFPKALAIASYVRKQHIDHIHAHWLTTPSTVAYVVSEVTGVPWSCTGHAHDVFSDNLLSAKAASAQFIRVISRRNYEAFNARTGQRHRDRTRMVHVGVTLPAQAADTGAGEVLRIVCPARLHPMKGHKDLLSALALLRDAGVTFHCDLAGDGELREVIEKHIAALRLSNHVTLRGIVPHDVLLGEIRTGRYDVVALSSVEDKTVTDIFEGIPVALIEAMAAGVPCIATHVGSIDELVDAQSGILVEQHDPTSFARALGLLARDRAFRQRLGRAARERVRYDFDVRTTAVELYDLICANTRSGVERAAAASPA